jgi:DNA-nicking Smr family endonuclease
MFPIVSAVTARLNLRRIVLETAIDYHRVLTTDSAEQPLATFLVGRAAARGLR